MAQKEIHIHVSTDGSTNIDAKGFQGGSCTIATREMELLLAGGPDGVDDKKKPEYYGGAPGLMNTQTSR